MVKFFWVYGMAVLLFMGLADFRGWSFMGYDQAQGVPKSLRDNPGSYRSTYGRTMHK